MHNEVTAIKNKLNSQMFFKKDWFNNLLVDLTATQINTNFKQGDYVKVKITRTEGYTLFGELV